MVDPKVHVRPDADHATCEQRSAAPTDPAPPEPYGSERAAWADLFDALHACLTEALDVLDTARDACAEEPVYGRHLETINDRGYDLLMQIRCAITNAERARSRAR